MKIAYNFTAGQHRGPEMCSSIVSSMLSYATLHAQFLRAVRDTPQNDQTDYLRSRRCR